MSSVKDVNFDDLESRFADRIYAVHKGQWRLQLLQEDLAQLQAARASLDVWDAGCGFAQISLWFAGGGHRVSACDLSEKMLDKARAGFAQAGLEADFYHGAFQDFPGSLPAYDLVLSHAVLEWLADPLAGLDLLLGRVTDNGYLSLMFYNRNAMVYKNVLRGQWRLKPIIEDSYIGRGNKLSPPNPLYPHEISDRLVQSGFEIVQHTGVRVFHDYLPGKVLDDTDMDELMLLEKRYCRMPAYRDMGRYVHLLARKTAA